VRSPLWARRYIRVAKPGPFAWNYTKTLVQTSILWAVFLFVVPSLISDLEHDVLDLPTFGRFRALAVVGFCVFGALGLWGGLVMARVGRGTPLPIDTAPVLVVSGPYRYVRNPMAISAPGQAVFVSLWLDSTLVLTYAVLAAVAWNHLIRPPEELDLEERFGEPYRRYRAAVRCWLPRRRGYGP